MPNRNLLLALLVACLGGCIGNDVTPQNTNIAGKWNMACHPVSSDCTDFSISFDSDGDITEFDLNGHKGATRGTGSIVDSRLKVSIGHGGFLVFVGVLDSAGRSATGAFTNGREKSTPATLTRQ